MFKAMATSKFNLDGKGHSYKVLPKLAYPLTVLPKSPK